LGREGKLLGEEGKRVLWRILRLTAGWSLIAVGVVGLFLPILQGFLFIFSGLAILSTESPWARRLLDKLKAWRKDWRNKKKTESLPPKP
jgi:uncharacterized membrane protein YbaN (DUF454 family)